MNATMMGSGLRKIATVLFIFLFRELRRLILCFLAGAELIFVGCSLFKLAVDGPAEVLHWWVHLQSENSSLEHMSDPFSWKVFVLQQSIILTLVATLWFFERRYQRRFRFQPTNSTHSVNFGER